MRWIKISPFLFVLIPVALSGCATMRYPGAYKVEGKEFREFKELDDEKALKVVALIYNVKHEAWEDGIARGIALDRYLELLKKRRSKYVNGSGVFKIEYEKVTLSSWTDEDLMKFYDTIEPKARAYYMESAPDLSEMQNAERIVYLTSLGAVETEMQQRNNSRNAVSIASQVLLSALSIALSMI